MTQPALIPVSRGRRILVSLGWTAAIALTVTVTWAFTRKAGPAPAPAGGHNHAAPAAAATSRPVTLSAEESARIGVTFAPVLMEPLERTVRTVAEVTYDETRLYTVAPRIDGWVEQLFVDYTGQAVEAGAPLFKLYSPMLLTTEEEYLLARRLAGEVSGGTPEAVAGSRDLTESALRRLRYWEVPESEIRRLEETGEVQRTVTLRSPAAGVVVEKNVIAGQRIMAGDAVYRIADLSTVWLEGEVYEQDLPAVHLGQEVTSEFQALPGEVRTGRITYVYPVLNPDTRTVRVRVALPNRGLRLKPGMFATIRFTSRSAPALTVPRSAVLVTGERNLVFLKQGNGRFMPRDITPGRVSEDRLEVLKGLAMGDTVVASATFLMDAESNLGTLLGGMGNMPGMDMSAPKPGGPAPAGRH